MGYSRTSRGWRTCEGCGNHVKAVHRTRDDKIVCGKCAILAAIRPPDHVNARCVAEPVSEEPTAEALIVGPPTDEPDPVPLTLDQFRDQFRRREP